MEYLNLWDIFSGYHNTDFKIYWNIWIDPRKNEYNVATYDGAENDWDIKAISHMICDMCHGQVTWFLSP